MTPEKLHPALAKGIIIAFILLVAGLLCIPNFVTGGPSKTTRIIRNLRQLDRAKQQWALDHGGSTNLAVNLAVTKRDVAPYLQHAPDTNGWVKAVAGEIYLLKTLVESPEAQLTRELEGRPKGTVIRLGNHGEEFILPSPDKP